MGINIHQTLSFVQYPNSYYVGNNIRCGNASRTDLCGGPPVRAVPTATILNLFGSRGRPSLPRAATWEKCRFQVQLLARFLLPGRLAEGRSPHRRLPQRRQLDIPLRQLYLPPPIPRQRHRPLVYQPRGDAVEPMPQTAPTPRLRRCDQLRRKAFRST